MEEEGTKVSNNYAKMMSFLLEHETLAVNFSAQRG
jgi:hypothetical protein